MIRKDLVDEIALVLASMCPQDGAENPMWMQANRHAAAVLTERLARPSFGLVEGRRENEPAYLAAKDGRRLRNEILGGGADQ